MGDYYNRSVKTGVWVITSLKGEKAEQLVTALTEDGATPMTWPSHTFLDTVKSMASQGWKHVVGQAYPYTLDVNFISVAAVKHLKNTFGPNAMLTGSHNRPYQHALDRRMSSDDDYRRLFDELLNLEGETELSHIFQMASRKSKVYVSHGPIPQNVVQKLAQNVLTVGPQDCMVSTKGKTADDIVAAVRSEIDNLLNLA